jgi:predicted nucleotidyltransferase component of viral defense system
MFGDPILAQELRFRGGTALNKLHFPRPLRYSEDIDLVRATGGPIRPVLDHVHDVLDPWLGQPKFDQSPVAPKFRYVIEGEDNVPIRLKIEINTREREAYDQIQLRAFKVENPWFSGAADIPTFSIEEMLATKLRALLQRKKGRDLIDLSHALTTFEALDVQKVVELFGRYLAAAEIAISRTQAEQRMFEKLDDRSFMADVRPLLAAEERDTFNAVAARASFIAVFDRIVRLIPGAAWERTDEMRERFGLH